MQSWFANVKMRNYEANSVFDVHIHLSLYIMSATVTCESFTPMFICLFIPSLWSTNYNVVANKNN